MRLFIDTEFLEAGPQQPIRLVSIGIAAEDGRTFYRELDDVDLSQANDWVKANVVPYLTGNRSPRQSVAEDLSAFLGTEPPEFWAFCGAYDWVVFCQIFGRMSELPKGMPHFYNEMRQEAQRLSVSDAQFPPIRGAAHNALNDAVWTKDVYDFLKAVERGLSAK